MTLRDLPIGPPTIIEPPTISETLGTWATGLADHIDTNQFAALKAMAGLTVDPDVLEINGHTHQIEHTAVYGDTLPTVPNDCPACYPPNGGPYTALDALDDDQA